MYIKRYRGREENVENFFEKRVPLMTIDQYLVKVDGTGRTAMRNRKHLRKFQPIPKHPRLPTTQPGLPTTTTTPDMVTPLPGLPTSAPEAMTHQPPLPANMPEHTH